MIGAVNINADAVASSTKGRAVTKQAFETKKMSERAVCARGRTVRSIEMPRRGQKNSIIHTKCPKKRAHTTCHTGYSPARYFAIAFIPGRRLTPSSMKPIATSGSRPEGKIIYGARARVLPHRWRRARHGWRYGSEERCATRYAERESLAGPPYTSEACPGSPDGRGARSTTTR